MTVFIAKLFLISGDACYNYYGNPIRSIIVKLAHVTCRDKGENGGLWLVRVAKGRWILRPALQIRYGIRMMCSSFTATYSC